MASWKERALAPALPLAGAGAGDGEGADAAAAEGRASLAVVDAAAAAAAAAAEDEEDEAAAAAAAKRRVVLRKEWRGEREKRRRGGRRRGEVRGSRSRRRRKQAASSAVEKEENASFSSRISYALRPLDCSLRVARSVDTTELHRAAARETDEKLNSPLEHGALSSGGGRPRRQRTTEQAAQQWRRHRPSSCRRPHRWGNALSHREHGQAGGEEHKRRAGPRRAQTRALFLVARGRKRE